MNPPVNDNGRNSSFLHVGYMFGSGRCCKYKGYFFPLQFQVYAIEIVDNVHVYDNSIPHKKTLSLLSLSLLLLSFLLPDVIDLLILIMPQTGK